MLYVCVIHMRAAECTILLAGSMTIWTRVYVCYMYVLFIWAADMYNPPRPGRMTIWTRVYVDVYMYALCVHVYRYKRYKHMYV